MIFKNFRYIYIGPYLEEQSSKLAENLAIQVANRDADKLAWESAFNKQREYWQAKVDDLEKQLLYMAGVPVYSVPQADPIDTNPPKTETELRTPGKDSILADETQEEAEMLAWYRDMRASLDSQSQDAQARLRADESIYSE